MSCDTRPLICCTQCLVYASSSRNARVEEVHVDVHSSHGHQQSRQQAAQRKGARALDLE